MDKIWLQIVLNIFLFDVNFNKSTIVRGVHGSDWFRVLATLETGSILLGGRMADLPPTMKNHGLSRNGLG